MENKKKLTISENTKKSYKNFNKTKFNDTKTVIIDKKQSRPTSNKPFGQKKASSFTKKRLFSKPTFQGKTPLITSDFEKRKLAEQRATKRLKDDNDNKDKKTKLGTKKKRLN